MKFKIDQLIAQVDQAIARTEAQVAKQHTSADERRTKEAAAWHLMHADDWSVALTKMRTKLRKGQALTYGDLPYDTGTNRIAVLGQHYRGDRGTGAEYNLTQLRELRLMLEAAEGPTVTMTELQRGAGVRCDVFSLLTVDIDDED